MSFFAISYSVSVKGAEDLSMLRSPVPYGLLKVWTWDLLMLKSLGPFGLVKVLWIWNLDHQIIEVFKTWFDTSLMYWYLIQQKAAYTFSSQLAECSISPRLSPCGWFGSVHMSVRLNTRSHQHHSALCGYLIPVSNHHSHSVFVYTLDAYCALWNQARNTFKHLALSAAK